MIHQSILYFVTEMGSSCKKKKAMHTSTLNSPLSVWKGLWPTRVQVCSIDCSSLWCLYVRKTAGECIVSCYGQCKVVKCCLCTVCLMSHLFMYSNIHTQCILNASYTNNSIYQLCLCLCLLKYIYVPLAIKKMKKARKE